MEDMIIITKTVEDEAKNVLNRAVNQTIRDSYIPNLIARYGLMVLQHIITNDSFDKLDYYIEECSIRLPIKTKDRNRIKHNEIEPFMIKITRNTLRYIQSIIPRFITGKSLRAELAIKMAASLPSKGVIYKGMPGNHDLIIMAQATLIYRRFQGKELVYVASVDNHFKPNPVQVGSYLSPSMAYTGELDSTIRDKLADKFGFIGEDPQKLLEIVKKEP